jgi:hypothetical protein
LQQNDLWNYVEDDGAIDGVIEILYWHYGAIYTNLILNFKQLDWLINNFLVEQADNNSSINREIPLLH